jgi:ABC-type transport system involved in cytochrome c biogenesis permease subunit
VWVDSAGFDPTWFRGAFGQAISVGMLLAIIAYILGVFVLKPRLNQLGAAGMQLAQATDATRAALTAEMNAARQRVKSVSIVAMVLLLIVVVSMAVARYL